MAKSRKQKNQKIYDELDVELKNNKEHDYEEKLKHIDPNLDSNGEANARESKANIVKRNEHKNSSALTVIAKKVNGDKPNKKHEMIVAKKDKKENKKKDDAEIIEEEILNEPISYTDKLSIEEILRVKLEQQQKIRDDKRNIKKSPTDTRYTAEMMNERIKPHVGVDVRKEVNLKHKDFRWAALAILIVALVAVIITGVLLIFEII